MNKHYYARTFYTKFLFQDLSDFSNYSMKLLARTLRELQYHDIGRHEVPVYVAAAKVLWFFPKGSEADGSATNPNHWPFSTFTL